MKETNKIIEIFYGSLNNIKRDLLQLELNIKNKEKLNFETRNRILDSTYTLETAVYRAAIYNLRVDWTDIKKVLQNLNSALNTLVMKGDYEFIKIVNCKIIALLTFTIDHC